MSAEHGTLGLSSPWCRQAIPTAMERRDIERRIPPLFTVGIASNSSHTGYRAYVLEHGESMSANRVIHDDRRWFRDVHDAIDLAIAWLDRHLQEAA